MKAAVHSTDDLKATDDSNVGMNERQKDFMKNYRTRTAVKQLTFAL